MKDLQVSLHQLETQYNQNLQEIDSLNRQLQVTQEALVDTVSLL